MVNYNDPLAIAREAEAEKGKMKSNYIGVFCPQRNKYLFKDNKCHACNALKSLWNYSKDSQQYKTAVDKSAKMSFWVCATTKANPNKWMVIELGKNVGNEILDGIAKKGWTDVLFPSAGKGRELGITKGQASGYNKYTATPNLDKCDWEIPQSTIDSAPNMDTIIDMVKGGALVDGENFMKISSLKNDETFVFRLLPPHKDANIFKLGIAWAYRHFGGVSQDEVDGKTAVDLTVTGVEEEKSTKTTPPWENEPALKPNTPPVNSPVTSKEKCFGMKDFFDANDNQCKGCKDFKACGREVIKS